MKSGRKCIFCARARSFTHEEVRLECSESQEIAFVNYKGILYSSPRAEGSPGESDYLRQLEDAAKMPPAKKRKGKSLPSGVEDEG